jgi:hypothetical protein
VRAIMRWIIAAFYVTAGVAHFAVPEKLLSIAPSCVFPPADAIRVLTADVGDMFVRAVAMRFGHAIDPIIGHVRYFPLIIFEREAPVRSRRVSSRISLRAPGEKSRP